MSHREVYQEVAADSPPPPGGVGPVGLRDHYTLISPNILREARLHFGCPEMSGVLLAERLYLESHLSLRHFNVCPLRLSLSH